MPTTRRRSTRRRFILTLDTLDLADIHRLATGWRPGVLGSRWQTWEAFVSDYAELRDEFLASSWSTRTDGGGAVRGVALPNVPRARAATVGPARRGVFRTCGGPATAKGVGRLLAVCAGHAPITIATCAVGRAVGHAAGPQDARGIPAPLKRSTATTARRVGEGHPPKPLPW